MRYTDAHCSHLMYPRVSADALHINNIYTIMANVQNLNVEKKDGAQVEITGEIDADT